MALYTTWDEEMDAVEFALAWCDWAGGRTGDQYSVKTTRWPAGEKRAVQGVDGLVVTARRGNDVVVLDGIPAGMDATPLLTSVWNTTRNRRE